MDRGEIMERGTHAELMAKEDGLYRRYYEELAGGSSRALP
jgi:ABC-type multidrug transport system fused ATPase/permease subunit